MKNSIRTLLVALLAVIVLMAIFPISVSADDPIEILSKRTQNSKTYDLGNGRYGLDSYMGSIHYQAVEGGDWLDIDTTIRQSVKPNWGWEVIKGHWTLLIKDDTTIAVSKDGNTLGFRLAGIAYLDSVTKDYEILQTRQPVTPTVGGNKIRWENIFNGVNLEYVYQNDRFKENIEVTQVARDWARAHPPSNYGLSNQDSYLVFYFECDWSGAYSAYDSDGLPIDWNVANEFETKQVLFSHPDTAKIISALPLDYVSHAELDPEDWLPIRKRFIKKDGVNYLLSGAKATALNSMPEGTLVFDSEVNEQVVASTDDGYSFWNKTTGAHITTALNEPGTYFGFIVATNRQIGSGFRFQGVDVPNLAVILHSYIEGIASANQADDMNFKVYFEAADDPATFALIAPNRPFDRKENGTVTKHDWDVGAWAVGTWYGRTNDTLDIAGSCQEVVNRVGWATGQDMVVFIVDDGTVTNYKGFKTWDDDPGNAAKLHIEYKVVAPPTVTSSPADNLTDSNGAVLCGADLHGNVTALNDTEITERGFVWDTSTHGDPGNVAPGASAYADSWTETGSWGVGAFEHTITGLTELNTYYFRSCALNDGPAWAYGNELTFFVGECGKVYLELRPDLDETKIRGQAGVPADAVVNNFVGYTLPIYADDFQMLEFTVCVPNRWDGESDIIIHVDYCLSVANEADRSNRWEVIWDYATPNDDVIPALPGYESNYERYFYSNNQYEFYQDELIFDYNIRPDDPIIADDILTFKVRRETVAPKETDANDLIVFAVDVLFARGDFLGDVDGGILDWMEENMDILLLVLALIALGLTYLMFTTKERMLGFACAIFWAIFGAYCYTLSTTPWVDTYFYLAFASMFGMVIFTIFAAYGLREKRDTIADEDMDEEVGEEDTEYIGEEKGKSEDMFSMETDKEPSRRTRDLRERAKARRTGDKKKRSR